MQYNNKESLVFESVNDLVRHYRFDMSHWINKEASRFIRRDSLDNVVVKLDNCPDELLEYEIKCSNGHIFVPKWLEKRQPNFVFFKEGKGLLRQSKSYLNCPICSCSVEFDIPQSEFKMELPIYGDEAFRCVDGKTIFTYSFLSYSGGGTQLNYFRDAFSDIKNKLAPSMNPDEWVFHMKELLSKEKRESESHLSHLSASDVKENINSLLKLVSEHSKNNNLNIYCAVGIAPYDNLSRKKKLLYQSSVYNSALLRVIKEHTKAGLAPKFYFERTKSDGWAKKLFDGGRLTLLWQYITNGLPVMSPRFVEPSYHYLLEIADLVSYVIARHLFCIGKMAEGKEVRNEFHPSALGSIRYVIINGNGSWILKTAEDFPSTDMFRGTEWEKFV